MSSSHLLAGMPWEYSRSCWTYEPGTSVLGIVDAAYPQIRSRKYNEGEEGAWIRKFAAYSIEQWFQKERNGMKNWCQGGKLACGAHRSWLYWWWAWDEIYRCRSWNTYSLLVLFIPVVPRRYIIQSYSLPALEYCSIINENIVELPIDVR